MNQTVNRLASSVRPLFITSLTHDHCTLMFLSGSWEMFQLLIYWKAPATLSRSAFLLQKHDNRLWRLWKLSADTSCAGTEETLLYDSTEARGLTWENVRGGNAELEQTESLSPPSHSLSLSYSLLFSFPFVFISALYVWFSVLFSWCLLWLLVPFLPVIFSVFHSPAPAYLFYGQLSLSGSSHSLSPLIAYAFIPLRLPAH